MKAFKNFINGKHVEAADGRTTKVVNPVTGKAYATAPLSAQVDVDVALQPERRESTGKKTHTIPFKARRRNRDSDDNCETLVCVCLVRTRTKLIEDAAQRRGVLGVHQNCTACRNDEQKQNDGHRV